MAIEIREAVPTDLDSIVACHNSACRRAYRDLFPAEYLDGEALLERQREQWAKSFAGSDTSHGVRVAEVDGKVVGFCAYEPADSSSSVELLALYVEPFHWSMGIGSALQRDARDLWRQEEFTEALVWTADLPRAQRSYKKNGWVPTDETKEIDIDGHKIPVEKLVLTF